MTTAKKLSPLQLELLKIYSFNPEEEDLIEIKRMLGQYFAKKLRRQVDAAIEAKGITNEDLDKWANE
jgi:hypothetical protein